jgi:hypothetical protein
MLGLAEIGLGITGATGTGPGAMAAGLISGGTITIAGVVIEVGSIALAGHGILVVTHVVIKARTDPLPSLPSNFAAFSGRQNGESLSGRDALDDLHSRSQPGRGRNVREVPGGDPDAEFRRIADPSTIKPHRVPARAAEGALEGEIAGGGRIFYRPITASGNPAIEISNVPGYQINWKYHFPP